MIVLKYIGIQNLISFKQDYTTVQRLRAKEENFLDKTDERMKHILTQLEIFQIS